MFNMIKDRLQLFIYFSISLTVLVLTWLFGFSGIPRFQVFFGPINPLIGVCVAIILGILLISFLSSRAGLVIYCRKDHGGLFYYYLLAAILFVGISVVDFLAPFPKDMDVVFPQSLLFYPAIGFIVEVIFHLLPLSLFVFLFTIGSKKITNEKIMWAGILLVALLEPLFQVLSDAGHPMWVLAYTGLNVYIINFVQLYLFKKYDFVSMYSFRLVYYLFWHILWGYLRLRLLF